MIVINLDKAKEIGHDKRRAERAKEFAAWDIKATIPAEASAAEQARKDIRLKYALIQESIDLAQTPEQIKAALGVEQ